MNRIEDIIKSQFNRDITLKKYNNELLHNNQHLFTFNDEEYILEFMDNYIDIKGYVYLFYQPNLDFNLLENLVLNLYSNAHFIEYNNFSLLVSEYKLDLDFNTPYIIESETYKVTTIVDLNFINNESELINKLDLAKDILATYKNNKTKYISYSDFIIFGYINCINDSSYTFINHDILKSLDKNLLETGISFIENDLNITKTSNTLFLHRNTLIYRLDKIKEVLFLDLKNFKDAFIFYINAKSL